nr:hypothetical protein [Thioalkalivibrio denitrificans]
MRVVPALDELEDGHPGGGLVLEVPPRELAILPSPARELLALDRAQAICASPLIALRLGHPIADRLCRGLELPSQLLRVATRTDQLNHLLPELRRVCCTSSRHRGHLLPKKIRCPRNGVNSTLNVAVIQFNQRSDKTLIRKCGKQNVKESGCGLFETRRQHKVEQLSFFANLHQGHNT